jgi:hypothetical protein
LHAYVIGWLSDPLKQPGRLVLDIARVSAHVSKRSSPQARHIGRP